MSAHGKSPVGRQGVRLGGWLLVLAGAPVDSSENLEDHDVSDPGVTLEISRIPTPAAFGTFRSGVPSDPR
jgi:hypothetical protein